MNISNFIQRLAGNYETRSTTNDTNAIKAPLNNVKIGDELKVQVLHVGEDVSVVRLEDGSEISIAGRLPEDATEGTFLNILITDKGEGVPLKAEVLGTVKLAEDLNNQIEAILKDLNIPNTKENFNLVIEMSKNNIPINKENVSKAYEYVNTMNTNTENIMFLMKNDVEVSVTSVRAFDSMLTKSDFLETNLKVLIDTLSESINEINENINMNTLSSETETGSKFIMGEKTVQGIIENNNELNTQGIIREVVTTETSDMVQSVEVPVKENIEVPKSVNIQEENLLNTTETIQVNNQNNQVQNIPKENVNLEQTIVEESGEILQNANQIAGEQNPEVVLNQSKTEIVQTSEKVLNVTPEQIEKANDTQEQIQIKEVTITKDAALVKEEIVLNSEEQIKETEVLKPLTPLEQKEKLERLRDEVVGLFREVKNSKELGEEISQKRIFKSFKDVILDIEENKEIFTRKTTETLTKEVTRMKENISLVSDLNKYNTIVHIPLMINDNKSMAELYVFNGDKENSARKINENNATMFLSLGTANMGQIESYIKIVNKTIECNFMSESKIGVDVINTNKDHLAKLLDVYGYTLIKANADIYNGKSLNIFEAIEKNKKDEAKKGFDARA